LDIYEYKQYLDCLVMTLEVVKDKKHSKKKYKKNLLPSKKIYSKMTDEQCENLNFEIEKAVVDYETIASACQQIEANLKDKMLYFYYKLAEIIGIPKECRDFAMMKFSKYSDEVNIVFGNDFDTMISESCGHYIFNLNGWFTCHKELGELDIIEGSVEKNCIVYATPPEI